MYIEILLSKAIIELYDFAQRGRVAKCNFFHGENILNFTGAEVAMGGSELGIK